MTWYPSVAPEAAREQPTPVCPVPLLCPQDDRVPMYLNATSDDGESFVLPFVCVAGPNDLRFQLEVQALTKDYFCERLPKPDHTQPPPYSCNTTTPLLLLSTSESTTSTCEDGTYPRGEPPETYSHAV